MNNQNNIKEFGLNFYIISNNSFERVNEFCKDENIEFLFSAKKPLKKNLLNFIKEKELNIDECVMIGDQLLTDIYAANKFGCFSVLVDQLSNKDIAITSFNRKIEDIIYKKYKDKIKKGEYYG